MKVTPKNLKSRAKAAGFRSITELAVRLGRHRTTIHHAVRYPERYGRTYREIHLAILGGDPQ